MDGPAIEVVNAAKVYRIYRHPLDRIWQRLTGKRLCTDVWALREVTLSVPHGVTYGVVGRNGSGKSTLLQVLAGTVTLTSGRAQAHGRVSAVLELGAGFNPEFSGTENAAIGGLLAGLSRREMAGRMAAVRAFADIGEAFDRPLKTYSSGMIARLAFATAISVDPEILLIDEVLAVGDAFFQQRCMRRLRELQLAGVTIIFVTHDYNAVTSLCGRAAWLHQGELMAEGEPERVVREYLGSRVVEDTGALDVTAPPPLVLTDEVAPALEIPHIDHRYGSGEGEVLGIALDTDGGVQPGSYCRVRITARAVQPIAQPILGFTMRNRFGEIVTATNSLYQGIAVPALQPGDRLTVSFEFNWPALAASHYSLSPALSAGTLDQHRICDWIDNALIVESSDPGGRYGWLRLTDVSVKVALRPAAGPSAPPRSSAAIGG
ncbi:MAG: ABC transporter ATP-binding protein [Deltaproteobacteria bacterium]|nr:ABC transporter ATP-binding protein [Deltaproteobacteria bacterium]